MEFRLIGRRWKVEGETIEGFKVINVDLELAHWENNEPLFQLIVDEVFGGFPMLSRLHEDDFDKIIDNATPEDVVVLKKVKEWHKKIYPHGWVELEF